jgi:puromycin-sensitive aminopeptidase
VTDRPAYRLPRNVLPEHYSMLLEPDFGRAAFEGAVEVDIRVIEAASTVLLNSAELDIREVSFSRSGGAPSEALPAGVEYLADEEQVALRVSPALEPGPWRLRMKFTGQLNDLLQGFYRSKFRAEDGVESWIAVTQFQATDARRAFPCWDEPDFKATFGITIVADRDLTVLSNAHQVSCEVLGNGKCRTRFADTMRMSTYLVAIVIGPLELTSPREVEGVPVRIGSVPGRAALRGLAEDAAAHSLSFLRKYFSMPYPADKLDHIAVPDFASGAMENVGLVIYRETALLVSEESSQLERQRVVSTVAHETAHMWFGDLVTMRWWEGIWLNEAFATFMAMLVTDAFEPNWKIWASFGVDRAAALATDSLRSTRAIEYPVGRPDEAEDMFDVITYDKGGAVLRMIERYLGDETFRRGISHYLDKHRFSNTSTTDLWDALEVTSDQPVRDTMGTWVNQAGHPLVTADLVGPYELRLSQRRFLLDGGDDDGERWVVPVTLRYATAEGNQEHAQLLLHDASTTLTLKGEPTWLVVNEGAWGVYRAHYSNDLRQRLFGALGELDEGERLSLASDTWAATVAGLLPLDSSLQLWSALHDERDPDVWWAVSAGLGLVDLLCADDDRPLLQDLVRGLGGPLLEELGWEPQGSAETPREGRLRARLVALLGTLGADARVQGQALQRLADADAGREALPPDLATAVTQVVAAGGREEEWNLLYAHYKAAATPQDEVRYVRSLAGFSSPALLRRSLELTFSAEVKSQDAPYVLMSLLGSRAGCALAWGAIEEHWDDMLARWPSNSIHRMLDALPALAAAGESTARAAEDFLDTHPLARGQGKVVQSRERLGVNLAFRRRLGRDFAPAAAAALSVR